MRKEWKENGEQQQKIDGDLTRFNKMEYIDEERRESIVRRGKKRQKRCSNHDLTLTTVTTRGEQRDIVNIPSYKSNRHSMETRIHKPLAKATATTINIFI